MAAVFAGRVCVVTGGAHGMGREFVRALVADGARVATCDVDAAALARLRDEPAAPALTVPADLADPAARAALVTTVVTALGPIDLLVNNAGVGAGGPFVDIAGHDWPWLRTVDLDAPLDLMRRVIPDMRARGGGRILNVASMAGITIQPYIATYVASKHALFGLSRAVHEEVRHHGITVTVACPGPVRTRIVEHGRLRNLDASTIDWLFRFGLEPGVAARRMLRAAARGRPVIIPNHDFRLIYQLYRLAPRVFDRLIGRLARAAYAHQAAGASGLTDARRRSGSLPGRS